LAATSGQGSGNVTDHVDVAGGVGRGHVADGKRHARGSSGIEFQWSAHLATVRSVLRSPPLPIMTG
jgi:hypothetical protein